ncbi:MAG: hypothetical protein ACYDCO_27805 [Armatimonadota bacterium]
MNYTPYLKMAEEGSKGQYDTWYVLADPISRDLRVQTKAYCNRGDILVALYYKGNNILGQATVINNEYYDLRQVGPIEHGANQALRIRHLQEETRISDEYVKRIFEALADIEQHVYSRVRWDYVDQQEVIDQQEVKKAKTSAQRFYADYRIDGGWCVIDRNWENATNREENEVAFDNQPTKKEAERLAYNMNAEEALNSFDPCSR